MESKGTTVVASCIHQALTDSHRYTTLTDATDQIPEHRCQRAGISVDDAVAECIGKFRHHCSRVFRGDSCAAEDLLELLAEPGGEDCAEHDDTQHGTGLTEVVVRLGGGTNLVSGNRVLRDQNDYLHDQAEANTEDQQVDADQPDRGGGGEGRQVHQGTANDEAPWIG